MLENASQEQANQETGQHLAVSTKCVFVRPDGTRCQANHRKHSPYCFFHAPELVHERAAARSLGGQNRHARGTPGNYQIEGARDVLAILIDSLNESTGLPNSAAKNRTIGYLVSVLLKSFEMVALEARLKALEERIRGEL